MLKIEYIIPSYILVLPLSNSPSSMSLLAYYVW